MGMLDILGRYANQPDRPPPQTMDDFEAVANEASPDALGEGLEHAFNSDATPPFEQMVGHLYDRSDPNVKAGLLNEILGALGGGAGAALGGGVLGNLLRRGVQRVSPDEARNIPANDIEEATREAARQNPSLVQRVSRFYAQHPQLVQTLGQAAIAIAMNGMARRRQM